MSVLVDTNILSELARPRPNPGVVSWAGQIERIYLSVITVEEVHYGLAWKPNEKVETWFDRFLEEHCRLLPVTEEIARHAGDLRGRLRSQGKTRTQADLLIAATALAHALPLVTRNGNDFKGCDVSVVDPFV